MKPDIFTFQQLRGQRPTVCGHSSPDCKVTGPRGQGVPRSTFASRSWTISRKRAHQEPRVLRGPSAGRARSPPAGGAHRCTSERVPTQAMRRDGSAGSPATTPLWGREAPTGGTSGRTQHGRQLCKAGPRGLGAALRGGQSQRRVPEGLAANAVRGTPSHPRTLQGQKENKH